jgi:membrane protein
MKSAWHLHELNWKEFARELWARLGQDRVTGQAAQLAFYFLLSAFPLLLALTALVGLFLKSDYLLLDSLQNYLRTVAPASVSGVLMDTVQETARASNAGIVSFGLLFTLWAASRAMNALIASLNIIYAVKEARKWWKRRLMALGLTVGFMFLILAAFLFLIYGPLLAMWLASRLGFDSLPWLSAALEWGVGLSFVLIAFNLLYKYAPNVKRSHWNWLMPGTVAGVVLWLLSSVSFKIYLGYFDRYSVTYGSLGAVIILLVWFYITGLAVLMGAELNYLVEKACGQLPKQQDSR